MGERATWDAERVLTPKRNQHRVKLPPLQPLQKQPQQRVRRGALRKQEKAVAEGRGPKLIFQLGAAGTGKSTRMEDCYTTMDLNKETIVVADGDIVREAHTGLMAAFQLNKKTLIDGMTAAGSPELEQYTKELAEYADDKPIGFKDSEKWSYNDSGNYKDQFANDALDNKKDVVLGITNGTHLTKKYKKVISGCLVENAVFKQAPAIEALPQFSAMVKEH